MGFIFLRKKVGSSVKYYFFKKKWRGFKMERLFISSNFYTQFSGHWEKPMVCWNWLVQLARHNC